MTEELKPCPCCGGKAIFQEIEDSESDNFGGHFIECRSCRLTTNLRFACGDDPRPLLAETWNRREDAADAARYRWLRDHTHVVIGRFAGKYRATDVVRNVLLTDWMDTHEAAVDAAREATK